MLTLYHYDRSTAAQRVRLMLEEKALAVEKRDRRHGPRRR